MTLEIFVSHSHKDEGIASALVSFFESGIGVEDREIRCTSQLTTGLTVGADIADEIRRDIKRCEYFVPLVTQNSLMSEFVGFEIGAAWAFQKRIIPLVFFPKGDATVQSLLRGFLYRDLTQLNQLVQLGQELTSEIFLKDHQRGAAKILAAAQAFLSCVGGPFPHR